MEECGSLSGQAGTPPPLPFQNRFETLRRRGSYGCRQRKYQPVFHPPFASAPCEPGCLQACYVTKGDLELLVFLPRLIHVWGDETQSLVHTRQALYQSSPTPSLPFSQCAVSPRFHFLEGPGRDRGTFKELLLQAV